MQLALHIVLLNASIIAFGTKLEYCHLPSGHEGVATPSPHAFFGLYLQ